MMKSMQLLPVHSSQRNKLATAVETGDPPSKSQRKRDMLALQELGERLPLLNAEQLRAVPLDDELRQAVVAAQHMLRRDDARRRQLQFIGKLMRRASVEPIRAKLAEFDGDSALATARHRQIERWRERLLAEADCLDEFAREHPALELGDLRALLSEVTKERAAAAPPKAYRRLYRWLHSHISSE